MNWGDFNKILNILNIIGSIILLEQINIPTMLKISDKQKNDIL